jgi:hypothetical protein
MAMSEEVLAKVHAGVGLSKDERGMFEWHAKVGSDLIGKNPRLEETAQMVCHQHWRYEERLRLSLRKFARITWRKDSQSCPRL